MIDTANHHPAQIAPGLAVMESDPARNFASSELVTASHNLSESTTEVPIAGHDTHGSK